MKQSFKNYTHLKILKTFIIIIRIWFLYLIYLLFGVKPEVEVSLKHTRLSKNKMKGSDTLKNQINNPYSQNPNCSIDELLCSTAILNALEKYLTRYRPEHQHDGISVLKLLRMAFDDAFIYDKENHCKSKLDKIFDEVAVRDPNSILLKYYKAFKIYPFNLQRRIVASLLSYNQNKEE